MAFRWIHLSDFHFDGKDPYERNTVLNALLDEIRRRREQEGFQADVVFVSGDIAYSGQAKEYKAAGEFFDALLRTAGLDKTRLFITPGNHDVDKSVAEGLGRTLMSENESVEYFANGKPKYHFNKFKEFQKWYDRYFKGDRKFPKDNTCLPLHRLEVDGHSIGVLAINSALFSLPDGKDHNALWIGRRNLDAAVAELERTKTDLNFVLMHHPLDWLNDAERSNVKAALQQHADFILRGHLHQNEVDSLVNPQGSCFHIAAGACYQTREYPNTALFCTVDFNQSQLAILPIHYLDNPKPKWALDTGLFDTPDYTGQFMLPAPRNNKQSALIHPVTPTPMASETRIELELVVDSNAGNNGDCSLFINTNLKRFRVAFSFAGEKRQFVEETARILAKEFGEERILYDKFHEAEFARFDLGIYLPKLYREQADLIVPVLCKDYDQKRWTGWEWVHIYSLLTKDEGCRVMPSRFEYANVDGLSPASGYIELDNKTPAKFAELILQRLALNEVNNETRNTKSDSNNINIDSVPQTKKSEHSEISIDNVDPELLAMVVAILEQSGAATEQLANSFGVTYKTISDCRKVVAQTAVTTKLIQLVKLAGHCQAALRIKQPPDTVAVDVIARFLAMIFPAQDSAKTQWHKSGAKQDWNDESFQLLVGHATLAEIRVAALDKRPVQFNFNSKESHYGKGFLGEDRQHDGESEFGRDPDWLEFEKEVKNFLFEKLETHFAEEWRKVTSKTFREYFEERKKKHFFEEDEHFKMMINQVLEAKANAMADEITNKSRIRCEKFTYYFLIKTPSWMTQDDVTRQDAALQRLRTLFSGIAFLRLSAPSEETELDMLPFVNLHKLLNPNE